MATAFEIARLLGVIVLLVAAGVLATEPGKLPLALRALQRMMRKDAGLPTEDDARAAAGKDLRMRRRRSAAFFLVILAAIIALI